MSHRWELTWQGSGLKTGTDIIEAPTLNEALTIWQLDENHRLESPRKVDDEFERSLGSRFNAPWPRRIIKVRWKSEARPAILESSPVVEVDVST